MCVYRTNWLWRTGFGMHRQFPAAIDERRRSLLPGMRQYREEGANVDLLRDRLSDGKLHVPHDSNQDECAMESVNYILPHF